MFDAVHDTFHSVRGVRVISTTNTRITNVTFSKMEGVPKNVLYLEVRVMNHLMQSKEGNQIKVSCNRLQGHYVDGLYRDRMPFIKQAGCIKWNINSKKRKVQKICWEPHRTSCPRTERYRNKGSYLPTYYSISIYISEFCEKYIRKIVHIAVEFTGG